MFLSKFDSGIDLDDGVASVVLYCSQHEDKRNQHAVIAIELKVGAYEYKLYTIDFSPSSAANMSLYGNGEQGDWRHYIREGQVRSRISTLLANTTKQALCRTLAIEDGFLQNYRVGSYSVDIANEIINTANNQKPPNSPKFRYSGMTFDDDPQGLAIFNCITWAKKTLSDAGIDLPKSPFASILGSTGETYEYCYDQHIPKVHATDVSPSFCLIL